MINDVAFQEYFEKYKKSGFQAHWKDEKYKWEAVKHFQSHWDIDAADFADMLNQSLAKTYNLLASGFAYPKAMLVQIAQDDPEATRLAMRNLFDENKPLDSRVEQFVAFADDRKENHNPDGWKNHFQSNNAISVYLWLRYPNKYFIYKYTVCRAMAKSLGSSFVPRKTTSVQNMIEAFKLYQDIAGRIKKDDEARNMILSACSQIGCSDDNMCTAALDFGYYVGAYLLNKKDSEKEVQPYPKSEKIESPESLPLEIEEAIDSVKQQKYWWLNANPKVWSFNSLPVGGEQSYTLYNDNNHKRRIFQNFLDVQIGDIIIGYESSPVKQIVALAEVTRGQNGVDITFKKTEGLNVPIDYSALQICPELAQMEYMVNPQGSLFKLTDDEFNFIMDLIREENPEEITAKGNQPYKKEDFLNEVYMTEAQFDSLAGMLRKKKNVILQGAPGVGKTFSAKRLAYALIGEKDESRIEMIQFHQNYSYEDFIMGYKPDADGFKLTSGIFYRFCNKAANNPDQDYFFIIDEINRGNMSKIFGELLLLIEADYRGKYATLAYNGLPFTVPKNLYIIGMMNTADRSLAMIDYALRRRFSFYTMEPGFLSEGFLKYQKSLANDTFDMLIEKVRELNKQIMADGSLGPGFRIGHSYFCGQKECTEEWLKDVVHYDLIPTLQEYWFDNQDKLTYWENTLCGVVDDQ